MARNGSIASALAAKRVVTARECQGATLRQGAQRRKPLESNAFPLPAL
jgi:hypothetical protein